MTACRGDIHDLVDCRVLVCEHVVERKGPGLNGHGNGVRYRSVSIVPAPFQRLGCLQESSAIQHPYIHGVKVVDGLELSGAASARSAPSFSHVHL